MVLGTRIKALRLAQNLSQKQLADMAEASLSSIRRLESHGQGTLLLLANVAAALKATDGFDSLFTAPAQSIADIEKSLNHPRQRARVALRKPIALASPSISVRS
jgi:transcriptional regulator with XRE-family HTH domain